ncbi:energy transducer TonB [Arenimonas composti]|uniref:TonB C-terminal domain-containing protein n=1 Tax=Arenimonas composti TR7-09 = DSM 18010 TaxID=1121013 RepID=A0A091BF16_9GAMM|nr:energy transducer TonB [Arenimonas composti]KFN50132.1 hypothetical protein P873_08130 [Arenimonas composti TR7-09 = DSM 18010]
MSISFRALRAPAAAALLFFAALPAIGADTVDRSYTVRLSLDATGAITDAQLQGEVPAALHESVLAAAKRAEFAPARRGGEARPSRTSVNVGVRLQPQGDGYRAEIVGVNQGGGWQLREQGRPRFPQRAASAGYSARVVVHAFFDADGRLDRTRSRARSVQVMDRGGTVVTHGDATPARFAADFRVATEAAIRGWQLTPDEVDGQPMASEVLVPVTFCAPAAGACDSRFPIDDARPDAPAKASDSDVDLPELREPQE